MRKKYFLPKEMRERQGTQEMHRTERSITSWSRCFQNSPPRHYISNTERERRKPRCGACDSRGSCTARDLGPRETSASVLRGNAILGTLSSDLQGRWSLRFPSSRSHELWSHVETTNQEPNQKWDRKIKIHSHKKRTITEPLRPKSKPDLLCMWYVVLCLYFLHVTSLVPVTC